MEHAGLANKVGVVAAVLTHRYDALCLLNLRSGEQVKVMASHLQRITAADEARWAANAKKNAKEAANMYTKPRIFDTSPRYVDSIDTSAKEASNAKQ
jgi:hypothetical protein